VIRRKSAVPEVRVIVEVDGMPVGSLDLDIDKLWPLINHRNHEMSAAEWIDRRRFQAALRAVVMRNLSNRVQPDLYRALGNEIVKAELDIESFTLKAEAAAQAFGRSRKEVEKMASKTGHTFSDFQAFFWNYMMDESDTADPKKAWKASVKKR